MGVSPLHPVLGNPQFEPGIRDAWFRAMRDTGGFQASHFSVAGRWKTLAELMDQGGSYCLDFLRANQLNHFLRTMTPPPAETHTLTPLEELCPGTEALPHALSILYTTLATPTDRYQIPCIAKWEQDLRRSFSSEAETTNTDVRRQVLYLHKSPGDKL